MSQSETPVDGFLKMIAICADNMPVESTTGALRPVAEELTRLRSALAAAQEREKAAESRYAELERTLGHNAINALRRAMEDVGVNDGQLRADIIGYFCNHWNIALAKEANRE